MSLTVTVLGCSGTFAGPGEACSGYLVRSPGATVVVDLGPGTLAHLQMHVDAAAIDALVLTHEHPDHWLDLPILRNAMHYIWGVEGLALHAPAGALAAARGLIGDLAPTLPPVTATAGSSIVVGDQRLRFARTDHPVETLAVRVDAAGRSLLYTADTGPAWRPGPLGDVDLLLCEASLAPADEGRVQHLSARQAGALARTVGAGALLVTHVVPGLDDEDQRRAAEAAFGGPTRAARGGMTVDV